MWFKPDRSRVIDRYIDYFGAAATPVAIDVTGGCTDPPKDAPSSEEGRDRMGRPNRTSPMGVRGER